MSAPAVGSACRRGISVRTRRLRRRSRPAYSGYMLQESRIQEIALDSARASLAPIRVEAVTVAPMLDWMGQEALDVQVVVPESAVPKLRGKALIDFLMDLHDRLLAEGEQRHAFPHYATPEDLLAMPILNAEHLLDQAARLIVSPQPGPPRQVDIRRSISAAYYGLFHALLTAAADSVASRAQRGSAA